MDNQRLLDDLKQLLNAELSQTEERIVVKLGAKIEELRTEMQEGFAGVGAPISEHNDQIDNHEVRITKLEEKIA